MSAPWYGWLAVADCGCVAAVIVDDPELSPDELEAWKADKLARGYTVKRVSDAEWRDRPLRCEQHPNGRWTQAEPTLWGEL